MRTARNLRAEQNDNVSNEDEDIEDDFEEDLEDDLEALEDDLEEDMKSEKHDTIQVLLQ